MPDRRFRIQPRAVLCALAFAVSALSLSRVSVAAPKDAQAEQAIKKALEDDYLQTDFDAAETRLRGALTQCGASGCSPAVHAKVHVALGTVLAGGKKQLDDARDAFVQALQLDPKAALDPDFVKSEISFAFEEARKQLKLGGAPTAPVPEDGSGIDIAPPPEQAVNTPLPLLVRLDEEVASQAEQVVIAYTPANTAVEKELALDEVDDTTFRGEIPCEDTKRVGALKYRVEVRDAEGLVVAARGTAAAPLLTDIKQTIGSAPPRWPGFEPPKSCSAVAPDPAGAPCVDDADCSSGFECKVDMCVQTDEGPGDDDEETSPSGIRKNWVSVMFVPDVSIISGDDICSRAGQEESSFVCAREDGSRYSGTPEQGQGNNVNFGFGLATLRVLLAYDRLVLDNLALGLRAGIAFRGASVDGASFLPVHAEGRATYFIGKDPFASPGARPFVFLAGGLAQIDTPIEVQVVEDGEACGAADPDDFESPCTQPSGGDDVEERIQTLTAYKQAGNGFVGLGFGISYAPVDLMMLNLGVRVSMTLPVVTAVASPEAGVSFGF